MYDVFVKVRPGAIKFLEEMKKSFEIFIFTASMSEYGHAVIDILDPDKKLIS